MIHMKCALLFTSINIILLLSSTTSEAQETNNSQNGSVTNAEPAHAQYRLGDESTLLVKLNRTKSNEGNYHYGFRFQSVWTGKQVFVRVSGITAPFHLKINGFEYGLGDGPGAPLEYNITPFLKQELNEIQLNFDKADQNTFGNSFDGGMLIIREPVHVRDLEVTSYFQSETPNTLVRIHLFIQSYLSEQNKGRILMLNLSDPEGDTIFTHKKRIDFPLAFRQEVEFTFDQNIENPQLWSPDQPHLYHLQITMVEDGNREGELVSATFGIRSATFQDSVLVINRDTIRPVIAHDSLFSPVADQPDDEILHLFNEMGANALQTNRYLPSRILDLFDRKGIVVLKYREDQDPNQDRSDVNHPSIVWIE